MRRVCPGLPKPLYPGRGSCSCQHDCGLRVANGPRLLGSARVSDSVPHAKIQVVIQSCKETQLCNDVQARGARITSGKQTLPTLFALRVGFEGFVSGMIRRHLDSGEQQEASNCPSLTSIE